MAAATPLAAAPLGSASAESSSRSPCCGVPLGSSRSRALLRGLALLSEDLAGQAALLAAWPLPAARSADEASFLARLPGLLFPAGLPSSDDAPPRCVAMATVVVAAPCGRCPWRRTYVIAVAQRSRSQRAPRRGAPAVTCVWSDVPDVLAPVFIEAVGALHVAALAASASADARSPTAAHWASLCSWLVHDVPAPWPGTTLVLHLRSLPRTDESDFYSGRNEAAARAEGTEGVSSLDGALFGSDVAVLPSCDEVVADDTVVRVGTVCEGGGDVISLVVARAAPGRLANSHVPLQALLLRLGVNELLLLAKLILLERRIVLRSSSTLVLTYACESLATVLLFPLVWQHEFDPLLRQRDRLLRLRPFLYGLHRPAADFADGAANGLAEGPWGLEGLSSTYTIFDLDVGEVHLATDVAQLPELPPSVMQALRGALHKLRRQRIAADDVCAANAWSSARGAGLHFVHTFNVAAQEAFFVAVAGLVKGARGFFVEDGSADVPAFDAEAYVTSWPQEAHAFGHIFVQTAAFQAHIADLRLYASGESPSELAMAPLSGIGSVGALDTVSEHTLASGVELRELSGVDADGLTRGAAIVASEPERERLGFPLELHLAFNGAVPTFFGAEEWPHRAPGARALAFWRCEGDTHRRPPTWSPPHVATGAATPSLFEEALMREARRRGESGSGARVAEWARGLVRSIGGVGGLTAAHTPGAAGAPSTSCAAAAALCACLADWAGARPEGVLHALFAQPSRPANLPIPEICDQLQRMRPDSASAAMATLCDADVVHDDGCRTPSSASKRLASALLEQVLGSRPRESWPPRGYRNRVPCCFLKVVDSIDGRFSRQVTVESVGSSELVLGGSASDVEVHLVEIPSSHKQPRGASSPRDLAPPANADDALRVTSPSRPPRVAPHDPNAAAAALLRCAVAAAGPRRARRLSSPPGAFVRSASAGAMETVAFASLQPSPCPSPRYSFEEPPDLMKELRRLLTVLKGVDPQPLDVDAKLAFWLNVLNASTLAGLLLAEKAPGQRAGFLMSFPSVDWVRFMQRFTVEVGGLDFSLFDIEHSVLRGLSAAPAGLAGLFVQGQRGFGAEDPRGRLALCTAEPAASFGIAYPLQAGCPRLRLYRPEAVRAQLLLNSAHYLAACVHVDASRRRVRLPALFRHYARDFGSAGELITFARDALLAAPGAAEVLRRMGLPLSQADAAVAYDEAGRVAAQLETLREAAAALSGSVAAASAASLSALSPPLSGHFAAVSVRFEDFDWACTGFITEPLVCPVLIADRFSQQVARWRLETPAAAPMRCMNSGRSRRYTKEPTKAPV